MRPILKQYFPIKFYVFDPIELRKVRCAELMTPWTYRTRRSKHMFTEIRRWHQDCGTHDQWLVVWSTCCGTELKRPKGTTVYKCEPYHVYLVKNDKWMHRMPYVRRGVKRFFIRGWLMP